MARDSLGFGFNDDEDIGKDAFGSVFGGMKGEMMGAGKPSSARGKPQSSGLPSLPDTPTAPAAQAPAMEVMDEHDYAMAQSQANEPENAVNQGIQDAETDPSSGNNAAGKTPAEAVGGPNAVSGLGGSGAAVGNPGAAAEGSNSAQGTGAGGANSTGADQSGSQGTENGQGGYHTGGIVNRTGPANVLKGEGVLTRATVKGIGADRVRKLNAIFASNMPAGKKMDAVRDMFGSPLAMAFPRID